MCLKRIIDIEREVAEKLNFNFNNRTQKEFEEFQTMIAKEQKEKESDYVDFITDSSFLIQEAYSKQENPTKYDLNFFLPIEFDLEDD
jgi:hypothetical protein